MCVSPRRYGCWAPASRDVSSSVWTDLHLANLKPLILRPRWPGLRAVALKHRLSYFSDASSRVVDFIGRHVHIYSCATFTYGAYSVLFHLMKQQPPPNADERGWGGGWLPQMRDIRDGQNLPPPSRVSSLASILCFLSRDTLKGGVPNVAL